MSHKKKAVIGYHYRQVDGDEQTFFSWVVHLEIELQGSECRVSEVHLGIELQENEPQICEVIG